MNYYSIQYYKNLYYTVTFEFPNAVHTHTIFWKQIFQFKVKSKLRLQKILL